MCDIVGDLLYVAKVESKDLNSPAAASLVMNDVTLLLLSKSAEWISQVELWGTQKVGFPEDPLACAEFIFRDRLGIKDCYWFEGYGPLEPLMRNMGGGIPIDIILLFLKSCRRSEVPENLDLWSGY